MALLQNRIQGLGGDGAKKKVWKCPSGHLLQPLRASTGTCDGCKSRVASGDCVMECRGCNWYLCEKCHPQEKPRSWLWRSLSFLADEGLQELRDFKEVAQIMETRGPLAACAAPPVKKEGTDCDEEIRVVAEIGGNDDVTPTVPCTPVAAEKPIAGVSEAGGQETPPKADAPKENRGVDLLGLDLKPNPEKAVSCAAADEPLLDLL